MHVFKIIQFFLISLLKESDGEQPEKSESPKLNGRRNNNSDVLLSQKSINSQLATHDETNEDNEQEDDDDNASKGSNESKKSYNERVLNTKYENDSKNHSSELTKNQILRRKSLAPGLHSTITE